MKIRLFVGMMTLALLASGARAQNLPANGCSTTEGGNLTCPGTVTAGSIEALSGTFGALNNVLYPPQCAKTPGPSWCSGADLGAWINAACNAGAAGEVHIPAGSYTFTTPIVFSKTCVLAGDGEGNTTLQYTPTTGTALTLEAAFSGVKNLTLLGTGGSTTAVGVMETAPYLVLDHVQVGNYSSSQTFQTGITFGTLAFIEDHFSVSSIGNAVNILTPTDLGTLDAGEHISFWGGSFSNGSQTDGTSTGIDCVYANTEMHFKDTSFDGCQVIVNPGNVPVVFDTVHFEYGGASFDYPFVVISSNSALPLSPVVMIHPVFFVDALTNTATSLVQVDGSAALTVNDGATYFGAGGTSQPTRAAFYSTGSGNARISTSGVFTGNLLGNGSNASGFPVLDALYNTTTLYASDPTNIPLVNNQAPAATNSVNVTSAGGTYVLAMPSDINVPSTNLTGEYKISYQGAGGVEFWDLFVACIPYLTPCEMTTISHISNSAMVVLPQIRSNSSGGPLQLVAVVAPTAGVGTLSVQWLGDGFAKQTILPSGVSALTIVVPTESLVAGGGGGSGGGGGGGGGAGGSPTGCTSYPCTVASVAPAIYGGPGEPAALLYTTPSSGSYRACGFLRTVAPGTAGTVAVMLTYFTSDGSYTGVTPMNLTPAVSTTAVGNVGQACTNLYIDGGRQISWYFADPGVTGAPTMRYWITLERMQ